MARGDRRTLLAEMRLEQAQANYVRKVLGDSAKEIEERLAKVGTSGNPLTRMQLEAQRSAIKSMLDQDFKDIEKSIAAGKIDAAKTASKVVSQYENQLLKAVVSQDAMRRIARSEAQRTVNNLEAALKRMKGTSYKPLSKQVYKTKQLSAGWVDDIINKGLLSGWSAQQLAKAVVPSISPNVPGGVSYAANRLARTEINNAYHAASWDRYNRSGIVEEVEWLLSSSHPEDDICNDYATESPFKKNAVPAKPHPNCYCYIVPRLPTEEEFLDRLFAGEYGDEPWASEVKEVKAAGKNVPRGADQFLPRDLHRVYSDDALVDGFGHPQDPVKAALENSKGNIFGWRTFDDVKARDAALLQDSFDSERLVKSVASNIKEGKNAWEGVDIPEKWWANAKKPPYAFQTDYEYGLMNIGKDEFDKLFGLTDDQLRAQIERTASRTLALEQKPFQELFKGMQVDEDWLLKTNPGSNIDTFLSSFTPRSTIANEYATSPIVGASPGRTGSLPAVLKVEKGYGAAVEGNVRGLNLGETLVSGKHVVTGKEQVDGIWYITVNPA